MLISFAAALVLSLSLLLKLTLLSGSSLSQAINAMRYNSWPYEPTLSYIAKHISTQAPTDTLCRFAFIRIVACSHPSAYCHCMENIANGSSQYGIFYGIKRYTIKCVIKRLNAMPMGYLGISKPFFRWPHRHRHILCVIMCLQSHWYQKQQLHASLLLSWDTFPLSFLSVRLLEYVL